MTNCNNNCNNNKIINNNINNDKDYHKSNVAIVKMHL